MVNIQPENLRFITMGNSSFWQRACLEQMSRLRGQFFGMIRSPFVGFVSVMDKSFVRRR